MNTKLKVCGLTRRSDVEGCIALGVDALGLNFWPGSKRALTLEQGRALVDGLDRKVTQIVGVFVEADALRVAKIAEACVLDAVQSHGDRPWEDFADLGLPLVRVIRGTPELGSLDDARAWCPRPAWTILDAAVAGYGGQGHVTDWVWARRAVAQLGADTTWLAGGIRPDNVEQALREVRPAGVDVASGVELDVGAGGHKDLRKVEAVLARCRAVE